MKINYIITILALNSFYALHAMEIKPGKQEINTSYNKENKRSAFYSNITLFPGGGINSHYSDDDIGIIQPFDTIPPEKIEAFRNAAQKKNILKKSWEFLKKMMQKSSDES
jgi:hypothetical protein